jgi:hypothetical protein
MDISPMTKGHVPVLPKAQACNTSTPPTLFCRADQRLAASRAR